MLLPRLELLMNLIFNFVNGFNSVNEFNFVNIFSSGNFCKESLFFNATNTQIFASRCVTGEVNLISHIRDFFAVLGRDPGAI